MYFASELSPDALPAEVSRKRRWKTALNWESGASMVPGLEHDKLSTACGEEHRRVRPGRKTRPPF